MAGGRSTNVIPIKGMSILTEIKEIFYRTTGLALSFHYPDVDDYDFYPKNEKNGYCQAIQSSSEGLKCCFKSDSNALNKARESGEYCIYTCHAGLRNAVIPLVYKGQNIGAIFTGQSFSESQTEESFLERYDNLGHLDLDKDAIRKEFFKVKVLDEETFQLGIRLLNFMANYILTVEDELYLQSKLYQKEREILQYENEQMRLKNDLQKLSILILKDKMDHRGNLSPSDTKNEQKRALISRSQEFIELNYSQSLTLSDVAEAVYLSPNYFSTLFKEITGSNFSAYLNSVRIEQGKKLLREMTLPVKQIVEEVGFEDYNYFNKVFKKIVGVPPAAYREFFGKN